MNLPTADGERAAILELIRNWRWFGYAPPEAQRWLAEHAVIKRFAEGQIVFAAGQAASHVYGVLGGAFRIFITSRSGDEYAGEEVFAGGWFPHVVPDEPLVYLPSCVCEQAAVTAAFSQATMAEFARRWPAEYYRGMYHELSSRAVAIFGALELLSLHNLKVRLAVYLLRIAFMHDRQAGDGIRIPFESQSKMGSRAGGTRQRVNSVLQSWSRSGIIETSPDGLRILDIKRLTTEARKTGFDIDAYLTGWRIGSSKS